MLKSGKKTCFQCHMIEHQIGAYTDCVHGFGLVNVNLRIRLYYNQPEGLRIESGPDGTTVSFCVPVPWLSSVPAPLAFTHISTEKSLLARLMLASVAAVCTVFSSSIAVW